MKKPRLACVQVGAFSWPKEGDRLNDAVLSAQFKELIYKQNDKDAWNGGANCRGRNPAGLLRLECAE
jgi:hypothetical protein